MRDQNASIIKNFNKNDASLNMIDESTENIRIMIGTKFDQMGNNFKKLND